MMHTENLFIFVAIVVSSTVDSFTTINPRVNTEETSAFTDSIESNRDVALSSQINALTRVKVETWGECAGGWHRYAKNCYKWSRENETENWFQAELNCRQIGGNLVSIGTNEESAILRGITLCRNQYWIGLVNTEYKRGRFIRRSGWSWWDRQDHNYTRMAVINKLGFDCSFARIDGSWTNSYCSHMKRTWVCKKPGGSGLSSAADDEEDENDDHQSTTLQPTVVCPPNWVQFRNNCYFFSENAVNYFHAQLYCYDEKAYVVTIKSEQEQAFLQAVNGCDHEFWIGLEQANPCVSGGNGGHRKCWEWIDLSTVGYTNWDNRHPQNNRNECTHSRGYWENSKPCTEKIRFVCKKPVIQNK